MKVFIGILIFFTAIVSCTSDGITNQEVGSDFLESNVVIRVIDTFTVNTGTFKVDDLNTTSPSRLLLGNVKDEESGLFIKAQPYFQLSNTSFLDNSAALTTLNNVVFDSIGLVMNYDNYYKGDTLKPQTYNVHLITETVEPEEDEVVFFNSSTLQFDPTSIGEITFTPRPNRASDSLYIPINPEIGLNILNQIKNNEIEEASQFLGEYKGLTVISDTTTSSHILGFSHSAIENSDNNTSLRLYYHNDDEIDDEDDGELDYIDFVITDTSKLFNSISTDIINSLGPLEGQATSLSDSRNTVNSNETDNLFFLQGGTGLAAKISIPSIKNLNQISDVGTTLEAELIFRPLSSNREELQEALSVFIINERNEIVQQLTDITNQTTVSAILNENTNRFGDLYYSVDLSGYVETILTSGTNLNYSLMIVFDEVNQNVESTALEVDRNNNENSLSLSVTFLNF